MRQVLIVTDNKPFRTSVAAGLVEAGYGVSIAESGPDVMTGLSGADLVLMDAATAGLDVPRLLSALSYEGKLARKPYAAVLNAEDPALAARLTGLGVRRVVVRSYRTAEDVHEVIAELLPRPLAA